MTRRWSSIEGSGVLLGGAAWAALAVAWFARDHLYSLYDDAYIYFTYADHAAGGCGLRFRCDEPPVEGFTSPLYQLILVVARLCTADLESASQIIGGVATFATLLLVVETGRRLGSVLAGAAAMVYLSLHHHFMVNIVLGLETPLVALLVTALLRTPSSRTLLGLGLVTRPECAVFLVAAPILPPARRLRFWLPLAAVIAAVVLARWLIFHDVLPNTAWAKAGGTRGHLALGLEYLADLVRAFPPLVLAPLALLVAELRRAAAFFLAGSALWLLSFLVSGGDTFIYSRLAIPLVPGGLLLAALGVAEVARRAARREAVAVAAVLALFAAASVHARRFWLPEAHGFANVGRWGAVGEWIAKHHPGALVAVVPVGIISYRCDCRVLDLVGLTSREIARAGRSVPPELLGRNWIGHERHQLEWTLAERPELIVMTRFAGEPFRDLAATGAGFFAEWLLLQEIKAGRAPYVIASPEVAPGMWWLMFQRTGNRQQATGDEQ